MNVSFGILIEGSIMRFRLWLELVLRLIVWVEGVNWVGKDDAISALKQSVILDNPSDWQLLVELTSTTEY
jgi:hypothetical protein